MEQAWTRLKEVFDAAVSLPDNEQDSYIEQACEGDIALKSQVHALLISERTAPAFLDQPTQANLDATDSGEHVGMMIGRYKLLELIGEGGFGQVYVAEQRQPVKRRVALKIIKLGMDTRQVIARFEAERQALAMMDHPNIAKVFDAGATETGRPYFVMELVRGVPITEYCDTEKLDTHARLGLFTNVCQAIQHAHQKGVIHRDIKPSNVMVTLHDGVPVPKVIDFGVAKATSAELTEKTIYTQHRQMIGTPAYMSPEQAEMSGLDIDTRSDIYSLGVLLYELLTGTTPFDPQRLRSAAYGEIQRIICEEDPEKPSTRVSGLRNETSTTTQNTAAGQSASAEGSPQIDRPLPSAITDIAKHRRVDPASLTRSLRGDLDWIVMKCLEKDRVRRYETANGLAADVRRYLNDEPVEASPPTAKYRVQKFVKRNRVGVLAGLAIAAALVLGVIGTTWGLLSARDQAQIAQRELSRAVEFKNLITEVLGNVNPVLAQGKDITLLKGILDDTAKHLADGAIEDELVAAELHSVVGVVYRDLGLWDIAERHVPIAMEIRVRLLGKEHPITLQSMHEQTMLDGYQERFDTMEPLLLETLETRKSVLGAVHPDTLTSQDTLAILYAGFFRRFAEAEQLLINTLEARRRVLGSEHRDTLTSLAHLAKLYLDMNRTVEAELLFLEALRLRTEVLGEDDPDTFVSMYNLIELYEKQGKHTDVERLRLSVTDDVRRVLGEQHPYTMGLLRQLGNFYTRMERHDEACAPYEEELFVREQAQGMHHFRTWGTIWTLGEAYEKAGRHDEAAAKYRDLLSNLPASPEDAVELCRKTLLNLPDTPDTRKMEANTLLMVARIHTSDVEELRDPARAVEFAQGAVTSAQERNLLGAHHYLHLLALAQHQTGDTTEAIKTEQQAISVIPKWAEANYRPVYEEKLRTYQAALYEENNDPTDR